MTIYRGKTKTFRADVRTYLGSKKDLTGYNAYFMAKASKADADGSAVVTKTGTISTPTAGYATFELTPADTDIALGDYYYDIQLSDGSECAVLIDGILTVEDPVRDAT